MVSQKLFDSLPPFPKDIPTADVPKFSLAKLSSGDSTYARKLFETCCTTGFFLLEMGGDETGDNMIKEIDAMFDITNDVFDLDIEEKSKYLQDIANGDFNGCVIPVSNPGLLSALTVQSNKHIAREWIANKCIDIKPLVERR